MDITEALLAKPYILVIISGIVAFLLCIRIFPVIIYLSKAKNLMDVPCDRSTHTTKTPTLGGIGMFIAFSVTLIIIAALLDLARPDLIKIQVLIGGSIILLFLGIKDDLLILAPRKKIIGQLASSTLVVLITDIRIFDFGGILGIGELSSIFSIIFTIFIFILIINAYNLIDGIDGLAGSIAMLCSIFFSIYFILNSSFLMALVSWIIMGTSLGFLRFNLSNKRKIFMGDSGTMVIGFILAFQAIAFIGVNNLPSSLFVFNSGHIIALTVLSFPILDTGRVFFIRIVQRRSPFSADRNHIHHKLIDKGMSHKEATVFICSLNILLVIVMLIIDSLKMNVNFQLIILVVISLSFYLFPLLLKFRKGSLILEVPKLIS